MSDWADEVAGHILSGPGMYANALRKAKADGMREAADYVHSQGSQTIEESDNRYADWEFLKSRADAIEKGEHPPIIPDSQKGDNAG